MKSILKKILIISEAFFVYLLINIAIGYIVGHFSKDFINISVINICIDIIILLLIGWYVYYRTNSFFDVFLFGIFCLTIDIVFGVLVSQSPNLSMFIKYIEYKTEKTPDSIKLASLILELPIILLGGLIGKKLRLRDRDISN